MKIQNSYSARSLKIRNSLINISYLPKILLNSFVFAFGYLICIRIPQKTHEMRSYTIQVLKHFSLIESGGVKLGGYEVKIIGGRHCNGPRGEQYVEMISGTQYTMWLYNSNRAYGKIH